MGRRRWVCLAQKNEQTRMDKGPGSTFFSYRLSSGGHMQYIYPWVDCISQLLACPSLLPSGDTVNLKSKKVWCHTRHSFYLFCIFLTRHTLIQYSSSGWTSPAGYLPELGINSCVWVNNSSCWAEGGVPDGIRTRGCRTAAQRTNHGAALHPNTELRCTLHGAALHPDGAALRVQ